MLTRLELGSERYDEQEAPPSAWSLLRACARGDNPVPALKAIGSSLAKCDNFEYFVLDQDDPVHGSTLLYSTLPPSWGQGWDDAGYVAVDVRATRLSSIPRTWSATRERGRNPVTDEFLLLAQRHGIGSGITWLLPTEWPGKRVMVTWSGPNPDPNDGEARSLRLAAPTGLMPFANYFHGVLMAPIIQAALERRRSDNIQLSPREHDLLVLLSHGYSGKDVARAVQSSERTVEEQLRTVREKLDARNSTEAVAKALRLRLIT